MNGQPQRQRFGTPPWLPVAGFVAAGLLVYLPALGCGFVWNDPDYVTAPALRPLHGLWLIWFKLGATQQYYPLLHSAFWVEHRLWGDSPLGYHLVNVLLHAGSGTLLWLILRRLAIPGAWLAALLFIVHPVCVESVAWVSEAKNTFSTFLYLAAALAYLRFDERRRPADYLPALAIFVMALLCKTVAATLPGALLVVSWWRRGRLDWRRDVAPMLPWFAVGAASGLFSAWIERTYIGANGNDFSLSGMARVLVAGRAVWFYLGKLLWPAGINFIYPRWHVNPADAAQYAYPAAAALFTLGLWLARRRTRAPLAAWLFFVGSLFPTLGFLDVFAFLFSYVADHWQYLASIGIFTFTAAALAVALPRAPAAARPVLQALVVAVLGLLAGMSWRECGTFRDLKTFYGAILERNPDAFMAHNNLGIELKLEGRLDEAIAHYREAVRIRPDYAEGHSNLGLALFAKGKDEEGISHYRVALKSEPGNAVVHNNLGVALAHIGRTPEAIEQYRIAARLDPGYLDPALNLGFACLRLGRFPEAIASYERAILLLPDNANAENGLGLALAGAGRPAEAVEHYQKALRTNPAYAEAHCNLGAALGALGRYDLAEKEFEAALKADDRLPDAHYNLGLIMEAGRRFPEAVAQFEATLRLRPGFADAELQWGSALQSMGRAGEAQIHLDNGARLQSDHGVPAAP
jgi:tetratricopeptide (TPR) repeat protein